MDALCYEEGKRILFLYKSNAKQNTNNLKGKQIQKDFQKVSSLHPLRGWIRSTLHGASKGLQGLEGGGGAKGKGGGEG